MNERCSVALCTYNGEKYIQQQLESIMNQSHPVDEIVICDDGSTDQTVAIAKRVLQESGISYRIEQNPIGLGITKNFEKAIDLCRGEIVFLSDQDDVWLPNKVEYILNEFADDSVVFVYSDASIVDGEKNVLKDSLHYGICYFKQHVSDSDIIDSFVRMQYTAHGCLSAFRKEFSDQILPFPNTDLYHDSWISFCAGYFGKIRYIAKPLIHYRVHGNNVTQGIEGQLAWKQSMCVLDDFDKRFALHYYHNQRMKLLERVEELYSDKSRLNRKYRLACIRSIRMYRRILQIKKSKRWTGVWLLFLSFFDRTYYYRNINRNQRNTLVTQAKLFAADIKYLLLR